MADRKINFLEKIKVTLVDDHTIFINGLEGLLNDFTHINVIDKVVNGKLLIEKLRLGKIPHVVLLDIQMPEMDGFETCSYLRQKYPEINVIMLTSFDSEELVTNLVERGARGFLMKNADVEEIVKAIHDVITIGYYFNDKISKELIQKLVVRHRLKPDNTAIFITPQEKELARFLYQGKKRNMSKTYLQISEKTFDSHKESLISKTKTESEAAAIHFLIENKIVTEEFLNTPHLYDTMNIKTE